MAAVACDLELFGRFCTQLVLENGERMVLESFQELMLREYFAGAMETLVLLPKKNGKTSLMAALALFHLLTTIDAECVIGASSRDQATILFNQGRGLVERSDSIRGLFAVKTGFREIRSMQDMGRVRVLAADAQTADGVIPTLALVDELHRHRNADLYGVFRDGLGPRGGQLITISTAGSDDESPLGQMRKRAYKLPGVFREHAYRHVVTADGQFALHEWALNAEDDRDDIALVKSANPASWQTPEQLRARHDSPSTEPWQWARFACGVWVRGYEQWIARHVWDLRAVPREIADGAEVVLGFDGSYNGDSTGIVAWEIPQKPGLDAEGNDLPVPPPHGMVVEVWEKPERSPDEWTVPIEDVEDALVAACKRFRVREIAADPARWARSLELLEKRRLPIAAYPQSPQRMVEATSRFYQGVHNEALTHSGDEVLGRHVENAVVKVGPSGGQIAKPSKTSPLRIDLAVCSIMAFDRAHHYRPRRPQVVDLNEVMAHMGEPLVVPQLPGVVPVGPSGPADILVDAAKPEALDLFCRQLASYLVFQTDEYVRHEGHYVLRVLSGRPDVIAGEVQNRALGSVLGQLVVPYKPEV